MGEAALEEGGFMVIAVCSRSLKFSLRHISGAPLNERAKYFNFAIHRV